MIKRLSKLGLASIIVGASLVLSILGTFLTQTSFFSVQQTVVTDSLTGLVKTINANNEANGKDYGRTLTAGNSHQISMTVYKPHNASKDNKVPVVICAHGNCNTKEMQFMNFTELSKRGFAVVTVDLAGHGRTDAAVKNEGNWTPAAGTIPPSIFGSSAETDGCLAATEYAMSLDYVDETRVGVTGHSGGNSALTNVTLQFEETRLKYLADPVKNKKFTKKIAAFYCPSGTAAASSLGGVKDMDGFLLGSASGRYDELDTIFFGTHDMSTSKTARTLFDHYTGKTSATSFFPGDTPLPLGQYWNKDGRIPDPEPGKQLSTNSGIVIYNPDYTHPGSMFTSIGAYLMTNFFYSAFGVPTGASYIPGTSQTWELAMAFQILGLLAFFASAFVIGGWLLKRKRFASLNASFTSDNGILCRQEKLPSIKKWQEFVPMIVTFIPLVLLSIFTYKTAMNNAASRIHIDSYFGAAVSVAYYTLISGIIAFILIGVNYLAKRLCYLKHPEERTADILETAKLSTVSQALKSLLLAIEIVVLMYIPQIIAYFGFDVIFMAAVYGVGVPRLIWLPQILVIFFPIWLLYTVSNGALISSARFKEAPEWLSTLLCVVANVLPAVILVIVNYSYLVANGHPITEYMGNPAIFTWNFLAPTIFIALSSRYFFKKTGNIWTGSIVNALVLSLMATTLMRHETDIAWIYCAL